jgi:hypothetical protein
MSEHPIIRAASKVLSEEPIDLGAPAQTERERMVLAIKQEIEQSARARARRVWAGRLMAAAMLLLAVVGTWRLATRTAPQESAPRPEAASGQPSPLVAVASAEPPAASATLPPTMLLAESVHGTVNVVSNGGRSPLAPRDQLQSGKTIISDQGDATIAFEAGSRVQMEALTEATMSEEASTQFVALRMGAVTATVHKLGDRGRFIVRTDEAVVEAHGTVFRVARRRAPGCGLQTTVHLTEGRISVRDAAGERFLLAGEEWASACKGDSAPAMGLTSAARPPASVATTVPTLASTQPTTSSELTAQNALFSRAMAQKSRGDQRAAIGTLDELLTVYPTTQLREVACAQRMNIAATSDPGRASTLARAYVSEFPRGFARKDADAILAVP